MFSSLVAYVSHYQPNFVVNTLTYSQYVMFLANEHQNTSRENMVIEFRTVSLRNARRHLKISVPLLIVVSISSSILTSKVEQLANLLQV